MTICYRYELLRFPDPAFDFVDASYILTMEGETQRRAAFLREIKRLRPSSHVFIQVNRGYRSCSKPAVQNSSSDLLHAYSQAMQHALARGFRTVAIFEDDVVFSDYLVRNRRRIGADLANAMRDRHLRPKAVFLGVLPFVSYRATPAIRRGISIGTHAGIYGEEAMLRISRPPPYEKCIDELTNKLGYKWYYHRPPCVPDLRVHRKPAELGVVAHSQILRSPRDGTFPESSRPGQASGTRNKSPVHGQRGYIRLCIAPAAADRRRCCRAAPEPEARAILR